MTIRRSGSTPREAYEALGATHLRVMTAGGGYETPAEHLAAALRWREALDLSVAS